MFQPYVSQLQAVRRFDRVVSSKDIEVGEVATGENRTALAIRVPTGEAMTIEPHAEGQLLANWAIPADHFRRLPRSLQAAELTHFAVKAPKDLTVRAVESPNAEYAAARSVMSGRYSPFDSEEVLNTIEPLVQGFEIQRPAIDRDEMVIVLTRPEEHDVSTRKIGDIVKTGLTIRNSEIGTMSLNTEFSVWRLKCLNGACIATPEVTVRQRHIYVSRDMFRIQLKNAIVNCTEVGKAVIDQFRASHALRLPNLDPDAGKLQESVVRILKNGGIWNKEFRTNAEMALGSKEEASVFGLIQYMTDGVAKTRGEQYRMDAERTAGKLLALAA